MLILSKPLLFSAKPRVSLSLSMERPHGTTILAARRDGKVAIGGDGQVSVDDTVVKANAQQGAHAPGRKVLAGFAGSAADAFTLFEKFEEKFERYPGNLTRAASNSPRNGAATACSAGSKRCSSSPTSIMSSCSPAPASMIEPDDGILAVGSGGPYALAAARALMARAKLAAPDSWRGPRDRRRDLHLHQREHHSLELSKSWRHR